jgi:hypothetical protein
MSQLLSLNENRFTYFQVTRFLAKFQPHAWSRSGARHHGCDVPPPAKSDVESDAMVPIPAKALTVAKQSSQYRVLVQIELEKYLGLFRTFPWWAIR